MKCRKCGKPMTFSKNELWTAFHCSDCEEEVCFCVKCGCEAENRTEHHTYYYNAGLYCPGCGEWLIVTSPALPSVPSKEEQLQAERAYITNLCLEFEDVYEDYPFHDQNWCVIRHRSNKKIFAWIFERNDNIWVNLKCDPQWTSFWRSAFDSVKPAYHLNKTHWNSVILDGNVPAEDLRRMVKESYDLTKKKP